MKQRLDDGSCTRQTMRNASHPSGHCQRVRSQIAYLILRGLLRLGTFLRVRQQMLLRFFVDAFHA